VLVLAVSGCGGTDPSPIIAGPSPVPPVVVPSPPVSPGADWLAGYTLTAASLSGVIYESTPTGHAPIPFAVVYCELCGEMTHTWATANTDGVYRFPGDLATGGGIWLRPGQKTPVMVAGVNFSTETWAGRQLYVLIDGDTRLDVELVRR
jgi:hypothetical protein